MSTRFLRPGHRRSFTAPTGGVSSDDVHVFRTGSDGEIGVVIDDAAVGETAVADTSGVHKLPKATGTGETFDGGERVYWDGTNVTTTATGNDRAGTIDAPAGASDATVAVLINDRPSR